MTEERAHELTRDCWCRPIRIGYGDRCEYGGAGDLVAVHRADGTVERFDQAPEHVVVERKQ